MSQINYAVSLHSGETATVKDVSRCCCPGDCSFESGLHQVCFSLLLSCLHLCIQLAWTKAMIGVQPNCRVYIQHICGVLKMAYVDKEFNYEAALE